MRRTFLVVLVATAVVCSLGPLAASGQQPPGPTAPASGPWDAPAFKDQFLGTYGVLGEVEPRLTPEERNQLELLIPLMSSEMPKAAEQLSAIVTDHSSALLDFTLGNLYFQMERLEEAAQRYRVAVDKFPSFRRAWKNLGLVDVRLGKMAEAATAITRMIELGGADGLSYGLLGQAYSALEDPLSAESAYRQAILFQPDSLDWKLGLARCLFKEQKYAEAAALCGELIDKHPDRSDFWLLQASAYVGLKEPLKAAQNYEVLDRMGKASVDMMNTLGDVYANEAMLDLAARAYLRALELDPQQDVERPRRAAEILAARGGLTQSKTLLTKIREVYGDRLDEAQRRTLLKLEARIAVSEGAGDEAARILEESVSLDPLDGEALMLLADYHARAGNVEKAIFYCERAESLESFEAQALLRHAELLVRKSRFQEALPLLRRAQEIKPRDEVARYLEQVERASRARR